jgi:carbonic anhydrase
MTDTDDLIRRNAQFAAGQSVADLSINPSGNMMVVGCVDPRADPAHVLGLKLGEAAVIRNVGGRITPATLRTMVMLGKVGQANADGRHAGDWNLVILHHTDCGMTDLAPFPELLAEYFEIPARKLGAKSVSDPIGSVHIDVDVIRQEIRGSGFLVSGLVYNVSTGLVKTVVAPTQVPTSRCLPIGQGERGKHPGVDTWHERMQTTSDIPCTRPRTATPEPGRSPGRGVSDRSYGDVLS